MLGCTCNSCQADEARTANVSWPAQCRRCFWGENKRCYEPKLGKVPTMKCDRGGTFLAGTLLSEERLSACRDLCAAKAEAKRLEIRSEQERKLREEKARQASREQAWDVGVF